MFENSRSKIERAKKHIADFDSLITDFQKSDFYEIRVDNYPNSEQQFLEARIVQSLPNDFALILGDTLHNLKAALDIAINEIVRLKRGKSDDFTRFPVRATRQELITAVNGGEISKASREVADFIVDGVKPYDGGNEPIWALHRLNIFDKHRLLLPVMQINGIYNFRIEHDGGPEIFGTWIITRNRTARFNLDFRRNVRIADKGTAALFVLFDEGLPLAGEPILPILTQFVRHVDGILNGIETVFR